MIEGLCIPPGRDRGVGRDGGAQRTVSGAYGIRDGSAYVRKSDCAGQDCVHSHEISRNGETIVCLPNKLLLEVKGGEKAYDSISK